METISDLHLHSRYSRAVSSKMDVAGISSWARKKGITLVGTGDWTHPAWLSQLGQDLKEDKNGLFITKTNKNGPHFLLSTEISCIYKQSGKLRRIHLLVFSPDFKTVEKINAKLISRGFNLKSDGRPILGISARDLTEIILTVNSQCLVIPAHAWTPHFSVFGASSGFDSIEECFGDLSSAIYAVETGLSSHPAMNWQVEQLDNKALLSFSDAHSPAKLGREATVFELAELNYAHIRDAIVNFGKRDTTNRIKYTIEFYPEEGKYHYSGHRECGVSYSPREVNQKGQICPVCKKTLTIGVATRVNQFSQKKAKIVTMEQTDTTGVKWTFLKGASRPPFVMTVPLMEIISATLKVGVSSKKVFVCYEQMINRFGNEIEVLLKAPIKQIKMTGGEEISKAIKRVRAGNIRLEAGYDGLFGKVHL